MKEHAQQLMEHIIRPALAALQLGGQGAEELVLGTACQESECGRYIVQIGGGPALGPFQMEPATHQDLHANFINHRPLLRIRLNSLSKGIGDAQEMVWNWRYAAAMCRIHYYRKRDALPSAGNLSGQAHYWKQHYNTFLGKGTVQEYVDNWRQHVG